MEWHPDRPHNHDRKEEATARFQVSAPSNPFEPLRNWLFSPELQWQCRGKRCILQGLID